MGNDNKQTDFLAGGEQTLNNTGYMTGSLDPYSQEFVEYAAKTSGVVADIGACYGIAVIPALARGARVIAVDNEPEHLKILRSRVSKNDLPCLQCKVGTLPNEINFDNESLSAILCCRVLHLLKGEDVEKSLRNMYDWLEKNGKLFLIVDSPYARYSDKLLQEFTPIYAQRKKQGVKWPGFIPNLKYYLQEGFRRFAPEFVHLFDGDVLAEACINCGFKIEKQGFIARPDYPQSLQYDGRENAGVVALKI